MEEEKTAARQPLYSGTRRLFKHAQIVRLARLIHLEYSPAELAGEIGVHIDTIYRSYMPAGAPFRKDGRKRYWILGTAFRNWALSCMEKEKESRHPLASDQAWCLACNQVTNILQPVRKEVNRFRALIQGTCEHCGSKVNRAIAAGDGLPDGASQEAALPGKRGKVKISGSGSIKADSSAGLILRKNWLIVRDYLKHLEDKQDTAETVQKNWAFLRHLLEWAEQTPLSNVTTKRPSFPVYLRSARNNGLEGPLAPSTMEHCCRTVKAFYKYQREKHPDLYRTVGIDWLETLKPSKAFSSESVLKTHAFYSLEAVRKLAALQPDSLTLERDQAAACFQFLTGMRIEAFISLPIGCVDLVGGKVYQEPSRGVRTKNSKAGITNFLPIPDLMEVVRKWDAKVRAAFPESAPWYARVNQNADGFKIGISLGISMAEQFAKGLRRLCQAAGVKYETPHKLRHGYAVYGLSKAKNMAQMKAVSQSLLHKSLSITDSVYAGMIADHQKDAIDSLTEDQAETPNHKDGWINELVASNHQKDAMIKELLEKQNSLMERLIAR